MGFLFTIDPEYDKMNITIRTIEIKNPKNKTNIKNILIYINFKIRNKK